MIRAFLSLLFILFLSAPVMAAEGTPNATLDVFVSHESVAPGGEIILAVRQNIRDDWHTYWVNPGDSGESTRLPWVADQDGVEIGTMQFPTPKTISYETLVNFGYYGSPIYLQTIKIADDFEGEDVTLSAEATWLICQDICIPESQDMMITIPVTNEMGEAVNQDIFDMARGAMPQTVDWHASLLKLDDQVALTVDIPTDLHNQFTDVEIFPYEPGVMLNTGMAMSDIGDDNISFFKEAGFLDLSDITDSRFLIVTSQGQSFEVIADMDIVAGQGDNGDITQQSIILILAFALLGGLILNLMPCVFPVLSMKAISLVKLSDKDRKQAQVSGLAYTAGIILSFLVIASALILLKSAGEQIGWGFQLQDPLIVAAIATLLFVIGLNLLGVFEISGRFAGVGSNLTSGNDVKSSFFTGVLATLVATPCSAPFMASAIGYALTQNAFIALSVFALLGLGLALPYLVLCFVPAVQRILPRPGAWMETFRNVLAFPMFASAIWLVWVLAQQSGDLAILYILGVFLAIGFLIWIYKRSISSWIKHVILCGFIIVAIIFAPLLSSTDKPGYENFTQQTLEKALVDQPHRPVFVNMTAAWCITCLVNERTSLSDASVMRAFENANVIYMKGDWTNRNAEISDFLEKHGRSGVPLYLYYHSANKDGYRPEPIILPQILTPQIVIDVINKGEMS